MTSYLVTINIDNYIWKSDERLEHPETKHNKMKNAVFPA